MACARKMHELNNPKSAAANIELTVTLRAAHRKEHVGFIN